MTAAALEFQPWDPAKHTWRPERDEDWRRVAASARIGLQVAFILMEKSRPDLGAMFRAMSDDEANAIVDQLAAASAFFDKLKAATDGAIARIDIVVAGGGGSN